MGKKKILYIINPRSGMWRKGTIEKEIKEQTDRSLVDYQIVKTTHRGHANELAAKHRDSVDVIVAVGGDGTVNEVGSALLNSATALGIIPSGSGNGLARDLDIPLRSSSAITIINETETKLIDTLSVGDNISLNVAGIGFDAYISHLFAKKRVRGPLQYMNLIAQEYPKYKPDDYIFDIKGDIFKRTAFLISFANSTQWGNNIHIAPNAMIDDGLMDVCIVSAFPNVAIPALVFSLLSNTIDTNKYDEMIRTDHFELKNDTPIMAHVDGEPITLQPNAIVRMNPLSLKVVVPSDDYYKSQRFDAIKIRDHIISTVKDVLPNIKAK